MKFTSELLKLDTGRHGAAKRGLVLCKYAYASLVQEHG